MKKRGRPRVYNGFVRRRLLTAIKKVGMLGAVKQLNDDGIPVTMSVAQSVAAENKLKFKRGRRKAS